MKRFILVVFAFACGSSNTPNDAGGTDSGVDSGIDSGADVSAADVVVETSTDAGTDASNANIAASASSACNSSGLYIATSANAITCGSPISTQLVKPYLQLRLPSKAAGTYDVASDCGQGGNVVEATFDDAQGTHDAVSGSVVLTNAGATVSGSYDLDFGTTKLKASFDAPYCP